MPSNYDNPQSKKEPDDLSKTIQEDIQDRREQAAANSGTANGLWVGSILAALVGLGVTAYYYWGNPNPTTIINVPPSPAAPAPATPQNQTTIIERTVEKPAPPPKVVEVPKPILVPGATKIIEVPKPVVVPTTSTPGTAKSSDASKTIPSAKPSPAVSASSEPIDSPASNLDTGKN
jgi:hypothetical protein